MTARALLLLTLLLSGCLPAGTSQRSIAGSKLKVDRITRTYEAHQTGDKFLPLENQPGELIWLTGLSTKCLAEDGVNLSPRFLGYSTLDLRWPEWHNDKFGTSQSARLFGLGRGLPQFKLPPGYGIPMHSNEPLWYTSRIVNPDPYLPAQELGQQITLDFTRERGLRTSMKAVLVRPVDVRQSGSHLWDIGPGVSEYRNEITSELYLTKDCCRLVGATAWMLDYGQVTRLKDLTTGETVLELRAVAGAKGEIQSLESYSESEGILLDPDHRFALEASFDNTGRAESKAGAYVNLYFADESFSRPPR